MVTVFCELAFVALAILECVFSLAVALALSECAVVGITVLIRNLAFAVRLLATCFACVF